jgi:hypothetical protein
MATFRLRPGPSFVFIFLLSFALNADAGAAKDLSAYTLRVHIFKSDFQQSGSFGSGSGLANLIDGQSVHGIEFSYQCDTRFMESVGNQAYAAKWKKPEKTIEIVGAAVGNANHLNTCEFKITMHDFVYDMQYGTLTTFTQEQYKARVGMAIAKAEPLDGDIAHYPLRLSVLKIDWSPAANGSRTGFGRGNLMSGTNPSSSVDFTTNCTVTFSLTPEGKSYAGQWKQEGAQMTLLLRSAGSASGLACLLNTSLHTDVYVSDGAGGVKAVSPQEYQQSKKP